MKTSDSIVEISKALVKAQSKIGGAVKSANNPFFKSKYSDLNSVIQACKEELNSEGISVLQPVVSDEQGDSVETVLLHESGEYISSRMKLVLAKQDMQGYGSAVSYARRYSLQSMVFIPSSEDDDGEKAMNRPRHAETTYKKPVVEHAVQHQPPLVTSQPIATPTIVDASVTASAPAPEVNVTTRTFRGRKPTSVSAITPADIKEVKPTTGMNF